MYVVYSLKKDAVLDDQLVQFGSNLGRQMLNERLVSCEETDACAIIPNGGGVSDSSPGSTSSWEEWSDEISLQHDLLKLQELDQGLHHSMVSHIAEKDRLIAEKDATIHQLGNHDSGEFEHALTECSDGVHGRGCNGVSAAKGHVKAARAGRGLPQLTRLTYR